MPNNLEFKQESLFENLEENEKKQLLANCSLLFNNPALKMICEELSTQQILYTAKETSTLEELFYGRGTIMGINTIYETILGYNAEYLASQRPEEKYDRHDVI